LWDRDTGRSLTSRGPVVLVDLGRARDLADLVDLAVGRAVPGLPLRGLVVLVDLGRARGLADLVVRVGRAVRGLAARVDRAEPDLAPRHLAGLVGRADQRTVDLGDRVDRAELDLALRDPAGLVGLAGRVGRADPGTADLAGLVDLGDRELPDRVHRGLPDRVDPADQVDRVDLHRRRTRRKARSIGVAHRWAVLRMRLTGSARPTTVRRRRPRNTDSAGMAGLLQERRRQTGTARRLQAAGTVRRLPAVGTVDGTGRRAT
jgi:hypothetical protein